LDFDGTIIEALPILHGGLEIFAFKFGRLAYLCDVSKIDQVVMEKLKGIDILIISALHHRPHPAHYTLSEALDVIEEIKPNTAYITHMSHEMGTNKSLLKMLPSSVFPAYDGQELSF
jgi:phosphoribosyl 1,2-cyclic phosphate phosphodiesterase